MPYGTCGKCSNENQMLVYRKRRELCLHCVDLELEHSGRLAVGVRPYSGVEPLNQPNATVMYGVPGYCRWCNQPAQPRYFWEGQLINFCGWGHAGMWMDREMGLDADSKLAAELAEGLEYVKRSLGIVD